MLCKKTYTFLFYISLTVLTIFRLLLVEKGALDDTDEWPYRMLLNLYAKLMNFENKAWVAMLTQADWSYIETGLRLFQTFFLKYYASINEIDILNPKALRLMGFFNIITYTLISILYYLILKRFNFSSLTSICGMVTLSTLLNFNIYTRHILPYGTSLMFMLIAVFYLFKKVKDPFDIIKIGFFAGLGFFAYVGHFMSIFMIYTGVLYLSKRDFKSVLKNSILFAIPILSILFLIEFTTQIDGNSYILHNIEFSKEINQGSPSEGLIYAFKYFHQVEGVWGITLLICTLLSLPFVFVSANKEIKTFLIIGLGGYSIYGSYVLFTGNFVFYGRILHLFYPFLIFGLIYFINLIKSKTLAYIVLIIAFVNYGFVVKDLNSLEYPRNFIYKNELNNFSKNIYHFSETNCYEFYDSGSKYMSSNNVKTFDKDVLIINACFFFHNAQNLNFEEFKNQGEYVLIKEANHFMSHPAYGFEYCNIEQRDFFIKNKFKIKLYSKE